MPNEILGRWPGEVLSTHAARALWSDIAEFRWVHSQGLWIKVALTPNLLTSLENIVASLEEARIHVSAAGNVAFLSLDSGADTNILSERLSKLGLSALTLKGEGPLWLGARSRPAIPNAVKQALDAHNRFPSLDA